MLAPRVQWVSRREGEQAVPGCRGSQTAGWAGHTHTLAQDVSILTSPFSASSSDLALVRG